MSPCGETLQIHGYEDPGAFSARVVSWLEQAETEHNLILGLLPQLVSGKHSFQKPIYLASIEKAGNVVGCAFRTPPFQLSVTELPDGAVPPLVEHVSRTYTSLPGVVGPESTATRFAELWGRQKGVDFCVERRSRIHALQHLTMPEPLARGRLRSAAANDARLVAEWLKAFAAEVHVLMGDAEAKSKEVLSDGGAYIWEDGEPKAMAIALGRTRRGVRIGYVYTKDAARKHGYATSLVATMSEQLLASGYRYCSLYTDLSNLTSNAIYARVGFRPVRDVVFVEFVA